jgi:hypothetical protein
MCGPDGTIITDLGTIPCTPTGFAQALYSVGLMFIGVVALLFIVYGGFLILTSQGSPDPIPLPSRFADGVVTFVKLCKFIVVS